MKKVMTFIAVVAAFASGCGKEEPSKKEPTSGGKAGQGKVRIAFVSNCIDPFWNVAGAGVKAGGREFNADVEVLQPQDLQDQKRMVEGLLARGIDGIAISPKDAKNQVGFLDEVAAQTNLITQDSDAPDSKRICFVGMDNYNAGRAAGKLVKEALPEGGKIMIFVGPFEQFNAQQRRQVVIDEVLDRPVQSSKALKLDPLNAEVKGAKYTIAGTRTG